MIGMIAGPGEKPTLADKFKLARDCGFEGLEIDWPAPIELDALAEAQDKSGLKIHGVVNSVHWSLHLNSPDAKVRAEAIIALESCVNAAATLKASSILLVPGVVNASMSYADCYTLSQQSIREVLPMAQAKGITIAVENVWNGFLLSPLEAAKYVDDLASRRGLIQRHRRVDDRKMAVHLRNVAQRNSMPRVVLLRSDPRRTKQPDKPIKHPPRVLMPPDQMQRLCKPPRAD
jgi:sugar phosphate isomerase/epimerase